VRAGVGIHAYQGFNCAAVDITVAAVIIVVQAGQLLGNRRACEALRS
jgi:ABC-type methionine transport system permease subunit